MYLHVIRKAFAITFLGWIFASCSAATTQNSSYREKKMTRSTLVHQNPSANDYPQNAVKENNRKHIPIEPLKIIGNSESFHSFFSNMKQKASKKKMEVTPTRKYPVVLIVVDALNARHVGTYGYERNTTPHMDSIAKEGLVFTQWISNSPWTRPSFTTILTGVPKRVHGMELTDKSLRKKIVTLAEKFKREGYATAAFVGNPLIQKRWGYDQGFDRFDDVSDHGNFPRSSILVDNALEWLQNNKEELFFLCLFLTDTHAPYEAPSEVKQFSSSYSNIIVNPSREVAIPLGQNEVDAIKAAYDDELAYVDSQVGRLRQWLFENELWNESSVVITADHGELFGEHNCYQHAYHMWEPTLRVPFIIRSPAFPMAGVWDIPATHMDLYPTLLHLNGMESKTTFGRSIFLSDLENENRIILSAYDAQGVKRTAARKGAMKLVRYEKVNVDKFRSTGSNTESIEKFPSLQLPGPRYELYDLQADPAENDNLFRMDTADPLVEQLKKSIRKLKQRAKKSLLKKDQKSQGGIPKLNDETLEALKAAGYIQ